MLILTRKLGEMIRIGDEVTVRVVEVRGNQIRLGVEAPSSVRIYREEIYRAIHEQNREAAVGGVAKIDQATEAWQNQRDK